jgi:hypothetical protein
MSNQFSYELDERQIKIMMQDVELEHCEQAWQKFDELSSVDRTNNMKFTIPNIHFGISRSIVIPIFFIILIAGLSSILFSFVDFKKKPEVIKEIPYQAPSKKNITVTKPIIAPVVKATILVADTVKPTSTLLASSSITTATTTVISPKTEPAPVVATTLKTNAITTTTVSLSNAMQFKRKKKKVVAEEIQTITVPNINLNEGSTEPELELK